MQEPSPYTKIQGSMQPSVDVSRVNQPMSQARHRSFHQSDSSKHLMAEGPGSHNKSLQRTISGNVKGATPSYKCRGETIELNCSCKNETERWQQGQWSGEEWDSERFTTKKAGMCKCMAGAAADCTAVCCCPLSLLHLLALACIKLPSIVVIRTLKKVKSKFRRKRKCQVGEEDHGCPTAPFTPSVSYRESLDGEPWTSSAGFADPLMWQECFGADAGGFTQH